MKDKIIGKLVEVFNKFTGSFSTDKGGFSARKLTAFIIIGCDVAIHIVFLKHAFLTEDFSLMIDLLIVDYCFVAVCLGLTSIETFIKLKQEKKNETSTPTS